MAQQVNTKIYGANGNYWNTTNGISLSFPTQAIVLRQLIPAQTYSGVVCHTQIQLLPTAPSPIQPVYYTPDYVADLVDDSNA